MWAASKRVIPPILLLLVGLTLLIYGARFHWLEVVEIHEEEIIPPAPPPPPLPPFFSRPPGPGGPGGPRSPMPPFFPQPPPGPPPKPEIVRRTVTVLEPEYKLVLEATRGGVTRLDDGRIKRTYSSSGAPPSGCPT